jgi:hypothetical protein
MGTKEEGCDLEVGIKGESSCARVREVGKKRIGLKKLEQVVVVGVAKSREQMKMREKEKRK